ncbi:hypothetical protein COLO4_26616 [Corchorus olitorius]|uniref:Uncharacterized protein n=1 Tax=Corchorus olitorius TaxID=93759 RepID=A0A1R3HVQ7_9ROSI|nr:hypothetical protein COLO4_26616 [Corchorus olitorius]
MLASLNASPNPARALMRAKLLKFELGYSSCFEASTSNKEF